MFKKAIILFSALTLFVSSSFAGETVVKKYAKVKSASARIYAKIPKGTNQKALFQIKKDAPLLVVIKPKSSEAYTKVLFKDPEGKEDKECWVRTSDIAIDMETTKHIFEPSEVKGDFWANSYGEIIDTKQDDIPLLEVELSFMDKIKTNTDKEQASRAAKK